MRALFAACGTLGGVARHLRYDEDPCDACKAARAEYSQARYQDRRDEIQSAQRIRRRALSALARLHPQDYDNCYREAFMRDLAENGDR